MNDTAPLSSATLLALAPEVLPNKRSSRYLGDNISVRLEVFAGEDQVRARTLYAALQELLGIVRTNLDNRDTALNELRAYLQRWRWGELVREIQQLGESTKRDPQDDTLGKVTHDIRGGGFQALSIMLQFIEFGIAQTDDIHRLFFLSRDHLKIMRNAVVDLDEQGYDRDRTDNLHNVTLLTEKWQRVVHKVRGREATVLVDCQFAGNVSERCLEFAALDRVLYNLMNNAVRNTADGMVYLAIMPFPGGNPENLRFVIYNAVSSEQHALLVERHNNNLGELFRGGFTTGGTGLGMRICAEFVTNAFGLRNIDEGLEGCYFGATLEDSYFINWFHWPIAAD